MEYTKHYKYVLQDCVNALFHGIVFEKNILSILTFHEYCKFIYFYFVWTPYFYATYERSSLQWLMRAHKQDGNYYMYMEGTCFWFLVKFLVSIWTQKQTNLLISANRNLFRQTFSKDNWQKITPVLRFGEKRNALKYNNVNFFTNFTLRWGSLRNRIILIRQNSLFKGITFKFSCIMTC